MPASEYYDLQRYLTEGDHLSILPIDELMPWCDPPEDPEWPTPQRITEDVRSLLERLPSWAQIVCALTAAEMAYPIWRDNYHLLPGIMEEVMVVPEGPVGELQEMPDMSRDLREGPIRAIEGVYRWLETVGFDDQSLRRAGITTPGGDPVSAIEHQNQMGAWLNTLYRESLRSGDYATSVWLYSDNRPGSGHGDFYYYRESITPDNTEIYRRLSNAADSAAEVTRAAYRLAWRWDTPRDVDAALEAVERGLSALELQFVGFPGTTSLRRWWELCRCRLAVASFYPR